MMNKPAILLAALLTSTCASAGELPSDPESWYQDAYGPLWAVDPGNNIDELLGFYSDTVETHSADGEVSRTDKNAWLREPMQGWLADGWLSAELQELRVDRINDTTASFKASWLDRYDDASEELSCGWYLADYRDGAWAFTTYADMDCAAHDF